MLHLNQIISLPILDQKKVTLAIKREDLIHPFISGNKFRKLKYNLIEARIKKCVGLLTFGGAYSNHIAATAYAGKMEGFKTIGIIRGEEIADTWQNNPTLKFAQKNGMQFKFVSRRDYRNKKSKDFLEALKNEFPRFYHLPEGGTNALAVKGCAEIVNENDTAFDIICCAVGTGGTIAGISNAASEKQTVLGFPAVKGDFLKEDIRKFAQKSNWDLIKGYEFGGYAKINKQLIEFCNEFKSTTNISLDPIYTSKMIFGILDMVKRDYFEPGTAILAIHTGGLQGIIGMNQLLKKKNLPLLTL